MDIPNLDIIQLDEEPGTLDVVTTVSVAQTSAAKKTAPPDADQKYYDGMSQEACNAINVFNRVLQQTSEQFSLTPKELYLSL